MGKVITAALLLATSTGHATPVPPPAADVTEVRTTPDKTARMTVPVLVNGQGPFPFIVDTGADRTVVSDRLASTLGLRAGRVATLHSMTGQSSVDTVVIDHLQVSTRQATNIFAPALKEEHLGGPGLLGIDSLARQRVTLDFKAGRMTIQPAEVRPEETDEHEADVIVVRARRKHGQLILTDATVGETRVRVVIDTGAQNSIANAALRRQLIRRKTATPQLISVVGVTGESMTGEMAILPEMKIGGLMLRNLPVVIADAHPFRKFGLSRTPALMLGMDALSTMNRVAIDFQNRTVRFVLPD
jgi:predicted aspartyl protease